MRSHNTPKARENHDFLDGISAGNVTVFCGVFFYRDVSGVCLNFASNSIRKGWWMVWSFTNV